MFDHRPLPPDSRAPRERRLLRMLQVLFFAAGQMGLALWLCQRLHAPAWLHAVVLGVTILGLIAAVRVLMVYLGLLARRAAASATVEVEEGP